MGMVLDFQKKSGYQRYVSPEMAAYKSEYKSEPVGHWVWGAVAPAGLAYNPTVVPAGGGAETWQEGLGPERGGAGSGKGADSRVPHVALVRVGPNPGARFLEEIA